MERPSVSHSLPKAVKYPATARGKKHLHSQSRMTQGSSLKWCRNMEIAPCNHGGQLERAWAGRGQRKVGRSGLLAFDCMMDPEIVLFNRLKHCANA